MSFFIAWLRKNPPPEFADWVWDSRRSLAIKDSDADFRRGMTAEAIRPRIKGETTFVDGLIAFAVDTANQCLVPPGIAKAHWDGLTGAERFYLKLVDLEARGFKTLDNYQNFAKALKVRHVERTSVRDEGPEYVLPFRVCVRCFIVPTHRKKQIEVP